MEKQMLPQRKDQKVIIRKNGTKRVQTHCTHSANEKARVQIQFQAQTDVNNIVAAYSRNPDPTIFRGVGNFQDNTLLGTYQDSLDLVLQANQAFDSLPAKTRARFNNDPANLLAFMQDPNNYDEGVSLGLVDPNSTKPDANKKQTNSNEQKQNASQNKKPNDEGTEKSKTTATE